MYTYMHPDFGKQFQIPCTFQIFDMDKLLDIHKAATANVDFHQKYCSYISDQSYVSTSFVGILVFSKCCHTINTSVGAEVFNIYQIVSTLK